MGATAGEHEQIFDRPFCDGLSSLVAAADDLKSPLSLIRQLSLTLDNNNLPIDERKRIYRQISITSERALNLTGDLTRLINLSDAMFELEPINPRQLCEDVISELLPTFLSHGRSITLSNCKHPLLLVANRDLLQRILINLSDNALRYTDKNKTVELKISSSKDGSIVRLGIRDYGPAMSSAMLSKFINGNIKNVPISYLRPQSSGLGMYIVDQFANVMNGKVGSIKHRNGMTFYIDLQASTQLNLL